MVRLMPLIGRDPHKFGINQDIDLTEIAFVDFPVHAVVDYRPVATIRDEASACHASQGGLQMSRGLFGLLRRWFGYRDQFMRAYPECEQRGKERKGPFRKYSLKKDLGFGGAMRRQTPGNILIRGVVEN